jgi:hypothetical protein
MVGFRQTFRDIVGDIVVEDEADERTLAPAAESAPATERDWAAEFAAADTIDELDAVVTEARQARVFKPTKAGTDLDLAAKARRRELAATVAAAWNTPDSTPQPAARPATSDHLPPANRAARRKANRKKGGRR